MADASVDVVISNCVLNLSPHKPQVWREIARVPKPGGRVAVSDLALLQALPSAVREDLEALVGCIAGAALVEEIRRDAAESGAPRVVRPAFLRSGGPDPAVYVAMSRRVRPQAARVPARRRSRTTGRLADDRPRAREERGTPTGSPA